MASGDGLGLFFNRNQIPCGPPAPPAPEVPPLIASSTNGLGTTATIGVNLPPITVDAPIDIAAGDTLLAFLHIGSTGDTGAVDLPGDGGGAPDVVPPAGWTLVRTDRATGGSHGAMRAFLYIKTCGASEPATYTFTWDSSALVADGHSRYAVIAIAGRIRSSAGIDTTSVGTAGSGALAIAGLIPARSGELLVGFGGANTGSGSSISFPGSWSQSIGPTYVGQAIGAFYKWAGDAGINIGTTAVTIGFGPGETSIGYVVAMLPG